MDRCPSCGAEFADRSLESVRAGQRRQLRRCPSCQRLATRETPTDDWTDAGTDPSLDYLFDWQPKPLPEPWYLVPLEQRTALEAELQAELGPQHPLFGQKAIAVARCPACDDVIFSIEAEPARFAQVHLTWRRGTEPPPWPRFRFLDLPLSTSITAHEH